MSESPFPEVRWGRTDSKYRRPLIAFGSTQLGSNLIKALTPLDRRILKRSKGKYTLLGPIGDPPLLLTTVGAKSGLPRTTPLIYVRDGRELLVIGSNFGQDHHPTWTANLRKNPDATVAIGGKEIPVRARQLEGDERQRGIDLFIKLAATYAAYLRRTDREIRVFALEARTD
ncbi:MAG TPA: nitroreductase/quinone reductase family protein [Jatrophihabitantaceae bacterium]|nr:nitroreductase/quinone reductase family protein [Jatrophihabitantaceae bacterium]